MLQQLIFNFKKHSETFPSADFIRHKGNKLAYAYIIESQWPSPITCLTGLKYTGKTYLLNLWANKEKAMFITPSCLKITGPTTKNLFQNNYNAFALDNLETTVLDKSSEENLFHLYNHCTQTNKKLLISSSEKPAGIPFSLPDLSSRLKSTPTFLLEEPSPDEKEIFVIKYFSDFQLYPDTSIIHYIKSYGPQCLNQLRRLVEHIYDSSMMQKRKITITLIREALTTFIRKK